MLHVEKTAAGCWEWRGGVDRGGYGKTRSGYRYVRTHRLAYEWLVGPIPAGKWVLHKCDNRLCLRPEHLFIGDHRDNLADARAKGRMRGGKRRVLTEFQVRKMRELHSYGVSITAIAKLFKRNNWTVKNAIEGSTWKRVANDR